MRTGRLLTAVAALSAAVSITAPAHAAADEIRYLGTFTAAGGIDSGSVVQALVNAVTTGTCKVTTQLYVGELSAEVYLNVTTGEEFYVWHGSGTAKAKKDCTSAAKVDVQIEDSAYLGNPIVLAGPHATARNNISDPTWWIADTQAGLRVTEFDGAYVRGPSIVRIIVKGSYTDLSGRTRQFGCVQRMTQVTPTPAGPVYGSSTTAPC